MTRQLDREVILAYVEEARGYLPTIRNNLQQFCNEPDDIGLLEEAHRHVHTIKGASSMVGFALLSHMAYLVEDTLEEIAAGQMALLEDVTQALFFTLDQIEAYLNGIENGNLEEEPLLRSVTTTFRRIRDLPVDGDEKAIRALLANQPPAVENDEDAPIPLPEVSAHISKDLRQTFQLEAEEQLNDIAHCLSRLTQQPGNQADLTTIRRHVHTLKGSAGLVGFDEITRLAHRSEDLLDLVFHGQLSFQDTHLHLLQDTADLLGDMTLEHGLEPKTKHRLNAIYDRYHQIITPLADAKTNSQPWSLVTNELSPPPETQPPTKNSGKGNSPINVSPSSGDFLRIPQKRLDDLVQTVSDLMIHRTTFEQTLRRLSGQTEELRPSIRRLQRISASIEREYEVALLDVGRVARGVSVPVGAGSPAADFDALEFDRYTAFHLLSRDLAETTHDLQSLSTAIRDVLGDFDSYLLRSSRLTSEAQDQVMKMRMVPLSTLIVRLQRAVRVTANQSQKKVVLHIQGEGIELDKTVLEEMADPLLHMLRNAVDHGIESPSLRQAQGKTATGTITLKAFHAGTQVVLQISDDGGGMVLDQLRSKGIAGGFITEAEAETLSDEALYELVFKPGFSTAGQVSEVSGRGVGLDIVKAVVQRLKGQVVLSNRPRIGMTITIHLPLTLAILKAILVQAGDQTYAIPLSSITQIIKPDPGMVEINDKSRILRLEDQFLTLLDLGHCLGITKAKSIDPSHQPILLINLGDHQVGLSVDRLLEAREIVVKNLGRHLTNAPGITGATLMGDGSVVLILNPIDLTRPGLMKEKQKPVKKKRITRSQVLVVDDSVSVRKVLSQLLHTAGYEPLTAKDGLDALEMLQRMAKLPQALILDIEMPRMDGYELTSLLRRQPRFKDLPILILTSRGAARHKERAEDLGATEYLVKPFRPEVLLNLLQAHADLPS